MPDPEQTEVNSEDPALASVAATGRKGAEFRYILEAELTILNGLIACGM